MVGISSFFNRLNFAKQVPLFRGFSFMDLQKIARKSQIAEYKKGDLIATEDSPADFFYCLISGRLQAYSKSSTGAKENIDFIHRGMHFGIISTLTGENHSLSFEALNDSVVLKIPKDDFQDILKSIPQLAVEFSQSLSKRIRRKVTGSRSVFESTIISVYSPVKDTGSTTYAVNLALSLAQETKKKVIFLSISSKDKPPAKNPESEMDMSPKWHNDPTFIGEIFGDFQKVLAKIKRDEMEVDLLNVSLDKEQADLIKHVSYLVSTLVGEYHYLVVDVPHEMNRIVLETLKQSDLIHLITSDKKDDLRSIREVIDSLELNLKDGFRVEKIKVIIRDHQNKTYLSFEAIDKFIDYHVYTMLPIINPDELTVRLSVQSISFLKAHKDSEYSIRVRRIAREIGGVLVGVVLGGGAALGVAHIGFIRVLEEENIPVDIIVGSSMGALVGSMWAIGKTSKELEAVAREFESKTNMLKLADLGVIVPPLSGVIDGTAIKRWLKKHLGNRTFYSTRIPFKAVSYDLVRRQEIVIQGGTLVDGVRESIAIPGVIKPILRGDQVIIDGGVLNPLPTNVLVSLGIKKIIAVNVLQSPEQCSQGYDLQKKEWQKKADISFFQRPMSFLGFRLGRLVRKLFVPHIADIVVNTLQATEHEIALQSAQQADVVIHPDLVGIKWYELDRVDDLIAAGEKATREALVKIRSLVEEQQF